MMPISALAQSTEPPDNGAKSATPAARVPKDRTEPPPRELEGVGITEKLGERLPLDAFFTSHEGRRVTLGELFDGRKPVILTLNYYGCPMLCGEQLNALLRCMKEMEFVLGKEYRVVTISFEPLETRELAYMKRKNYLEAYGRPGSTGDWAFLVGQKANIDRVLDATGFHIKWNPDRHEWMHAAAAIVCMPDGRISRYLCGMIYEPETMRLSLVEASKGQVGSAWDQVLLFCFHYDPKAGHYAVAAMNLVRAGGVLTALALGLFLVYWWRRERRVKARVQPA
jgi:protein SCO1/2